MIASRILDIIYGVNCLTSWKKDKTRKIAACFLVFLMLGCLFPTTAYAETIPEIRSLSYPADNIHVTYKVNDSTSTLALAVNGTSADINVLLTKGGMEYFHHISSEETTEIPLPMGNGTYQLKLRLYVMPTLVEPIWETTFSLQSKTPMAPWLHSSRIVNWTPEMALVKKARDLVVQGDQRATGLAICKYISEQYSYDHSITELPTTYLPDLELVYKADTGICYDYAALYTAMSRSLGIPCRLVMGYTEYMGADKYHAWCQIYVDGEWLTLDPIYSMENGATFLDEAQMTPRYFY